ncbi:hypothetical protein [Paraburkholderia unamae]|uniref:Uncharacterized protein n=1 Tax=Paraburkholderia unamae TaxID=219649 RepID=A0ABX5KHR8_9BURK|nr:hypothetical protein [Paraburkholderia unamae]PVX77183.1 hypothetical protein C7402_115242 [Paraburkholderia unamae]
MSPIDPRTRDNPEAAMVHAPSAAFFDHPHIWTDVAPRVGWNPEEGWRSAESLPGFDSEAHRAFMRSLG